MSILSYIFPQEIYKGSSKFSSDIRVIEITGSRRLLVNGIEQSGTYIDKILGRACDACNFPPMLATNRMLLLGIGGGSLIRHFRKHFPGIKVDAVDIDPEIIQVAQKYFGLDTFDGINLYTSDAQKFVKDKSKREKEKYGLVVIDLYIGRVVPDFVWEKSFHAQIRSLLGPISFVFINVVHDKELVGRVKDLHNTLKNLYTTVKEIPVDYNTFFLAST